VAQHDFTFAIRPFQIVTLRMQAKPGLLMLSQQKP